MKLKLSCFGLLLMLAMVFSAPTYAMQPFVEPYAGWSLLGKRTDNRGITEVSSDYNGLTVGSRLGVILGPIFVAADGSYIPSVQNLDSKIMRLGLTGGVAIPESPLRAWVGYNFLDTESSKLIDLKTKGTSLKFGAGITFSKLVSINAEYILTTYKSYELVGITGDLIGSNKSNSLLFSVSFPIVFGI